MYLIKNLLVILTMSWFLVSIAWDFLEFTKNGMKDKKQAH